MLSYASFLLALPGGDVRVTPRVLKVRGRQRRPAGEQRETYRPLTTARLGKPGGERGKLSPYIAPGN
jgi:hypothetical protein